MLVGRVMFLICTPQVEAAVGVETLLHLLEQSATLRRGRTSTWSLNLFKFFCLRVLDDVGAIAFGTPSIRSSLETMNAELNDICMRRCLTWKHMSVSFFPPDCSVVPAGNLAMSLQHIQSTRHPTRAAPERLQKRLCPFDPKYMKKKQVSGLYVYLSVWETTSIWFGFSRENLFHQFFKVSLTAVQCDRSPFQLRGIWVAAWTAGIQRANLASTVRSVSIQVGPPKRNLNTIFIYFQYEKFGFSTDSMDIFTSFTLIETHSPHMPNLRNDAGSPGFSNWSPKAGPVCRPA